MARQNASIPILVLRFTIPLVILAGYWYLRLPELATTGGDRNTALEWMFAVVLTLVGAAVMVSALVRLYRHLTRS